MVEIDAIVSGNLPAYRLCSLDWSDSDPSTAGITLQTGSSTDLGVPEFNNVQNYGDGDRVVVDTNASERVWEVETASPVDAGVPLVNDGTGKVEPHDPANNSIVIVGYSLRQAKGGEIVTLVPFSQINANWLRENASGGGGFTNEKAQDAIGAAMVGTGAASVSYDDQNNEIAVDAQDTTLSTSEVKNAAYPVGTGDLSFNPAKQSDLFSGDWKDITGVNVTSSDIQNGTVQEADLSFNAATNSQLFSGDWKDITGKPNTFTPSQHGDSAHGPNYAKQSDLHSKYTDSQARNAVLPVATGDLNFNPATQGELNSVREGVAHSATATASGDGSKTAFTLSHGLGSAPSAVSVQATSADAAAEHYVSAKNNNNVEVTFSSAPAQGNNNLTFDLVLVE